MPTVFSQCAVAAHLRHLGRASCTAPAAMQLHYVYAECATATATTTARGHRRCLLCQFECKPKTTLTYMCVSSTFPRYPALQSPRLALACLFLCVSLSGNGRPAANCRAAQLCISLHISGPQAGRGERWLGGFWGLHI